MFISCVDDALCLIVTGHAGRSADAEHQRQ